MFKIALIVAAASAHPQYVSQLPNGAKIVVNGQSIAAIGHVNPRGGGSENSCVFSAPHKPPASLPLARRNSRLSRHPSTPSRPPAQLRQGL
jgi:hypothetical protein